MLLLSSLAGWLGNANNVSVAASVLCVTKGGSGSVVAGGSIPARLTCAAILALPRVLRSVFFLPWCSSA